MDTNGRASATGMWRVGDDLSRDVHCVLGMPIDLVDLAIAMHRTKVAATAGSPFLISTPNLNFLVNSRHGVDFRESLLASDLCLADGVSIVGIARLIGIPIE